MSALQDNAGIQQLRRVLSRILSLGEKFRVAEEHEFPKEGGWGEGVMVQASRKCFEMNMQSNAF